jgi:hypothetical protein
MPSPRAGWPHAFKIILPLQLSNRGRMHDSSPPWREVGIAEDGGEFHCAVNPSQPTITLWRRRRSSNSKLLLPSSMRKPRKRLPPSMKGFGTRKLAEPSQPKKFASACPRGLPPPLHAKGAERSSRNHRPHSRRRRRRCFPVRQLLVGPHRSTRPLSAHGKHYPKATTR